MHTYKEMVTRLTALAPASLFPTLPLSTTTPTMHTTPTSITCNICTDIPDRPIELDCGNIVCLLCITRWLTTSQHIECPCCPSLLPDHAHLPSRITLDVIGSQLVVCSRGCNRAVRAEQYVAHTNSQCQEFFEHSVHSPSRITLRDVLDKKKESPTTPAEKVAATNIISRLMAEGEHGQMLQLPTCGQVCNLHPNTYFQTPLFSLSHSCL